MRTALLLGWVLTVMTNVTAQRLIALRGKAKQSEVAAICGVAATTISNWENGVNLPPADAIALLARHWGVTADYLVGLSDHPQGWPPDSWVIDLDFVDAIRRQDGTHHRYGRFGAFAIPRRMAIVSSVEYQALEDELRPLLAKAAKLRRK